MCSTPSPVPPLDFTEVWTDINVDKFELFLRSQLHTGAVWNNKDEEQLIVLSNEKGMKSISEAMKLLRGDIRIIRMREFVFVTNCNINYVEKVVKEGENQFENGRWILVGVFLPKQLTAKIKKISLLNVSSSIVDVMTQNRMERNEFELFSFEPTTVYPEKSYLFELKENNPANNMYYPSASVALEAQFQHIVGLYITVSYLSIHNVEKLPNHIINHKNQFFDGYNLKTAPRIRIAFIELTSLNCSAKYLKRITLEEEEQQEEGKKKSVLLCSHPECDEYASNSLPDMKEYLDDKMAKDALSMNRKFGKFCKVKHANLYCRRYGVRNQFVSFSTLLAIYPIIYYANFEEFCNLESNNKCKSPNVLIQNIWIPRLDMKKLDDREKTKEQGKERERDHEFNVYEELEDANVSQPVNNRRKRSSIVKCCYCFMSPSTLIPLIIVASCIGFFLYKFGKDFLFTQNYDDYDEHDWRHEIY